MTYLNFVCLAISIGMLVWLKIFDVRNSTTQFINLLIIVVSNLGYCFLCLSTTLPEAILAQKIGYVGGVFMPAFYFLMVLEICHIDIKKYLSTALIAFQCVIYASVCTIGINDMFYKNVSLELVNGIPVLMREYGPWHTVQLISMFFYIIAAFVVAIYTISKNKTVDRRGVIVMVALSIIAVTAYIAEKATHFPYEMVPAVFVILMISALIPVYRSNLYTASEKEDIIDEQLKRVGFLTFDKKLIYQHSNAFMVNVFPELSNYRVGQKIEGCSKELQTLIDQIDNLHEGKHTDEDSDHVHADLEGFWYNDKFYEGMIHEVTNALGSVKGYTIELRDDTADRMVIKLKESYNEELSKEVKEKTKRIRAIQQKTIIGMATMVESRDSSTGGHIKRTSDVVRIFANKLKTSDMDLDNHFLHLVIRSAPMHDLGKIGVRDEILTKQGPFLPEEYEEMKKHSAIGSRMVREILEGVEEPDFVKVAENVAHYHHEKVNGMGYPEGLKGDEIPLEARIMALADVFDALVSKRCYKEAFSYDKAFDIIEHDAGTHFDADLAKVFISCRPELEEYYNNSKA